MSISKSSFPEYFMHLYKWRLDSFHNWPYQDGCSCTPEKMAEAGFFHCPTEQEPDAAKCFMCGKELDGWEPDDDPWKEHKSHSQACPFIKNDEVISVDQLPVEAYLQLAAAREKLHITKVCDAMIKEFKERGADTRKEMVKLAN